MVKIAVIMSGLPRSFQKTISDFKKNLVLLEEDIVDYYLHFYSSKDDDLIVSSYSPKDWICEIPFTQGKYTDLNYSNPEWGELKDYKYNVYSQFKNLMIAFSLIREDTYDIVIRTRYDIHLQSVLDYTTLNMDNLNIPSGEDFGGINDRFCISSYKNMKIYCEFFKHISRINAGGCKFHPETMLKAYLTNCGIPIHRFDCNTNTIIR